MARKNSRAMRQKDKLRKQQQRQQVLQQTFYYSPVDNQWRNEQIDHLNLPFPHIPTTSTSTGSQNLPLTDPKTLYKIKADGNCFFSLLAFVLTGDEKHHQLIRNKICEYMKTNHQVVSNNLPTRFNEDVNAYLTQSQMEQDGQWATEAEIITASVLLQTNIFVYTQSGVNWKWNKYSADNLQTNCGIYIYHTNGDHFDLVVAVQNSDVMLGISDNNCYQKVNPGEQRRLSSKQHQKRKYEADSSFQEEKRKKARKSYIEKKSTNEDFNKLRARSHREKYHSDTLFANELRQKKKDSFIRKYKSNFVFSQKVKDSSIRKYKSNFVFSQKVKDSSIRKYKSNFAFRQKVKDSSIRKYKSNFVFRQKVKDSSIWKYKTSEIFKRKLKASSVKKYATNLLHRAKLKASSVKKYATNLLNRAKLLLILKRAYHSSVALQKKKKAAVKKNRLLIPKAILKFKKSINDTPNYVCTVCIRTLYRSQVKLCKRSKYMSGDALTEMAAKCLTGKYVNMDTGNSKEWICHTCDRHLAQDKMPPQAQANNLTLDKVPGVLARLNCLERQLIALRIPFMKLLSLPRGGQRGVKGPVVNVPTDLNSVTSTLPRTPHDAQLVKVKLKRKLTYKGHYQYEWVNPSNVIEAIGYLIQHNKWYSNITFNESWLNESNDTELVREEAAESDSDNEEDNTNTTDNTTSDYPVESCLEPLDLGQEYLDTSDKIFCVAPGENQSPLSIFNEKGIDAMAFPALLPDGNFGLSADREIKLSPSKYFNVRLFSADKRFASDNQFIFFAQYVTEISDIVSKMSIALRKGQGSLDTGDKVTASMLAGSENLRNILKSDIGFRYLQPIRGSPPYWQRTMKDLYAMIHQLGIPTWFVTFSAGETRWDEVIRTLLKQSSDSRDVSEIEWSEKCKLIRENPVTCVRLFDHRVKSLFSDLLMSPSQPIGPIRDYFFRTEFQTRGSPHIHCLVWIKDAPKLEDSSDEEVCQFVDKYVTCQLPDQEIDPELYDIVTSVQMHSKSHTKSCRKNSTTCRFHFPRPPVKKTFVARIETEETNETVDSEKQHQPLTLEEFNALCKAHSKSPKQILKEVWTIISGLDSCQNISIDKVLELANVTYEQFQNALCAVSTRNSIYCKRNLTDSWVNNYNKDLLRAWNANLDIQYVVDAYSCVAYILSYISKAEAELGDLLQNAKKEAEEGNSDVATTMKKNGQVYIQNREISAQEAIYRVCSMHLKQCTRDVTFIPTGSKPYKMSLPINVIKAKQNRDKDDENIWMSSIIEKYYGRPVNDTFNNMCLADFCSKYTILPVTKPPKSGSSKNPLPCYELQQGLCYIKQKKVGKESVIRYPRFNRIKQAEEYYMTQLQLYIPHRSPKIKPQNYLTFEEFVRTGGVTEIINENRKQYEIDAEDIESAWDDLQEGRIREDAWSIIAPEAEGERLNIQEEQESVQENEELDEIPELIMSEDGNRYQNLHLNPSVEILKPSMTQNQIHDMMSKMNDTQQNIFYEIRNWCLQVSLKQHPEPFHLFLTGGAGTGKTHLIKCIYHEATRILSKTTDNPESTPVLLTAPTGTAAFNVEGSTIHSAFAISKTLKIPYVPLAENILNTLRTKFENLKILVIDEISMVDHKLLSYIHGRLCQVKQTKKYFGNLSIVAVGDFHQLPPVRASPLYKTKESNFADLWNPIFSVATLTEIMRQKDDVPFAEMLNRVRTYTKEEPFNESDLNILSSVTYQTLPDTTRDFLHVFPTNKQVNDHNETMVKQICNPVFTVLAKYFTKDVRTGQMIQRTTPYSTNCHEDLLTLISLGTNARVMLTRNIDTEDGLVNGAFGTVKAMDKNNKGEIVAVYIKFDNPKSGKKHMSQLKVKHSPGKGLVRITQHDEILQGRNITRKQFPFKLGWAATIHKVQGMTMKNVVVSLKKIFQPGMAYVALSRATSLKGLHIINFDVNVIYASADIKTIIDNMPSFAITDIRNSQPEDNTCRLILHNTEGLIPHQNDIKCQKFIENSHIVCFTETWMKPNNRIPKTVLPNHLPRTLSRTDAYDKTDQFFKQFSEMDRGGVATFIRKDVPHKNLSQTAINIEFLSCIIDTKQTFALSVIYRPPTYPIRRISSNLEQLLIQLETLKIPVIVLGDLNDDTTKPSEIKTMFRNYNYTQLVTKPTTESGTCLDNVYVKGFTTVPNVKVIPIYYSFHEAIQIDVIMPTD